MTLCRLGSPHSQRARSAFVHPIQRPILATALDSVWHLDVLWTLAAVVEQLRRLRAVGRDQPPDGQGDPAQGTAYQTREGQGGWQDDAREQTVVRLPPSHSYLRDLPGGSDAGPRSGEAA